MIDGRRIGRPRARVLLLAGGALLLAAAPAGWASSPGARSIGGAVWSRASGAHAGIAARPAALAGNLAGEAGRRAEAPIWLSGPNGDFAIWRAAGGSWTPTVFDAGSIVAGDAGRPAGHSRNVNGPAFLTGLMSAILPGAGQMRNGSYVRGFGYLAAEVTGWLAYNAFRDGNSLKTGELERLAGWPPDSGDGHWSFVRYEEAGCWNEDPASELRDVIDHGDRSRFLEYITRENYRCGWDSPLSFEIYHGIWSDREDLRSAQSWSSRLIFLNHLVSAVDAFLEARAIRLQLDRATQIRLDVRGLPFRPRPEVRITRHFG